MTADTLSAAIMALCVCAGVYSLADARSAPPHKTLLRLLFGMVWLYAAFVYGYSLFGPNSGDLWQLIRSGVMTRYTVLVACSAYTLEIYVNRQAQKRGKNAD